MVNFYFLRVFHVVPQAHLFLHCGRALLVQDRLQFKIWNCHHTGHIFLYLMAAFHIHCTFFHTVFCLIFLFIGSSLTVPITFLPSFTRQTKGEKLGWSHIKKCLTFKCISVSLPFISRKSEENMKNTKFNLVFRTTFI